MCVRKAVRCPAIVLFVVGVVLVLLPTWMVLFAVFGIPLVEFLKLLLVVGALICVVSAAVISGRYNDDMARAKMEAESAEFGQLVRNLQRQPLNHDSHLALVQFCSYYKRFSGRAYELALELIIQTGGDASVRVLALEIGRMNCAQQRPDGSPTIYDEQAIQNDIQTRI